MKATMNLTINDLRDIVAAHFRQAGYDPDPTSFRVTAGNVSRSRQDPGRPEATGARIDVSVAPVAVRLQP